MNDSTTTPSVPRQEGTGGNDTSFDPDETRPRIFVLEADSEQARDIARHLQEFRYDAHVFENAACLSTAVHDAPPAALLVDLESLAKAPFRDNPWLGGDSSAKNFPVVVLSDRDDWDARVGAVRGGGSSFLAKPIDFASLIEELDGLLGDDGNGRYRILIVDPLQSTSRRLEWAMEASGMETHLIRDPSQLPGMLADFGPDLILMSRALPGCTTEEASAVIRQLPPHVNLPVIHLVGDEDPVDLADTLRLGCDDLFVGTIGDAQLAAIVEVRARRYRKLKALIGRDDLTGLLNHTSFKLALEREVARSQRRGSVLSVAMLDLDHFKSVNDRFGHPVGDVVIKSLSRLLSHRLRRGDVVARYGGEEFAVVLPDTLPQEAADLLDGLRQRFAEISMVRDEVTFNVTLSVGIAALPPHEDVDLLITAADDAMYEAKRAGRNRVAIDAVTVAAES